MRALCIAALLPFVVEIASCTPRASDQSGADPGVELVRGGKRVALSEPAARVLVLRVEKALAACTFRSDRDPKMFGGADLPTLWSRRESAAHLRLRYPSDKTINAALGKLVFREVLLSVDELHGPEPALARDARAIFGLKKCGYDDRLLGCAPELAPHFSRPSTCPPGL